VVSVLKVSNPFQMLSIPSEFQSVISSFSSYFTRPTFDKAVELLLGSIICPASRTVCNVLRTIGLKDSKAFSNYHRVLNRAAWSPFSLSKHLVRLLLTTFLDQGQTPVFGVDETIERRRGAQITKKGIYRDPVRSSKSHTVKASGLRWMSVMLLSNLPWLEMHRRWALPFLSVICPSVRYYEKHTPRRAKKLTDWARQMILFLARYVRPDYDQVVLVGDGTYATYELMRTAQLHGISLIGRLKMNARLFHLPRPKPKGRRGPQSHIGPRILSMSMRLTDKRIKWQRVTFEEWYGQKNKSMELTTGVAIWDSNKGYWAKVRWVLIKDPEGNLDPVLLATNDVTITARDVVGHVVARWGVEVTFHEARRHLGMETQRQWSDLAIERTTPVLLALKSIVCLMAHALQKQQAVPVNGAAWYKKDHVTFSDVLALVRGKIWQEVKPPTSSEMSEVGSLRATIRFLRQILTLAVA